MAEEAARLAATPGVEVIIFEIPLLLDTTDGRDLGLEGVVVVNAADDVRIARLTSRDGLSPLDARRRLDAQVPLAQKVARADWVIDNNGPAEQTREQVVRLWDALRARSRAG
jgi:dephospho-CoA kinase